MRRVTPTAWVPVLSNGEEWRLYDGVSSAGKRLRGEVFYSRMSGRSIGRANDLNVYCGDSMRGAAIAVELKLGTIACL